MTVFRKPIKKLWIILLPAVAIMIVSHPAEAGVKKIWPDKFIPLNNHQNSQQSLVSVYSNSSDPVAFYADLKLPVGSEIKKLVYFHYGTGAAGTSVALHRQKLGKDTSPALMLAFSFDNTNQIVKLTNIPTDPAADLVVRKGYRYFLAIVSLNEDSEILGVRISYR